MSEAKTNRLLDGLNAILLNREKGAAELLRDAITYLGTHSELLSVINGDATLRSLYRTRPALAGFSVLARRIENAWRSDPGQSTSEILDAMNARIAEADRRVAKEVHRQFVSHQPVSLVTLSYSSTVRFALEQASALIEKVYVLESNPGGEGRMMADALAPMMSVEIFSDDQMKDAVSQGAVGIIGADTIFTDGVVLNKVLSRKLGEEFRAQDKPLFVVASTWKIAGGRSTDQQTPESDRFEEVPAELITRVISDS